MFLLVFVYLLTPYTISAGVLKDPVKEFVRRVEKESLYLKELNHSFIANSEQIKAPRGEFDTFLFSDMSYSDQDGAISGSFIIDNLKTTSVEVGLRKKWKFGIDTSLSHKYSDIAADIPFYASPRRGYIPVSTFSVSIPLLNNFTGANDRRRLRSIDLKLERSGENFIEQRETMILNILRQFFNARLMKEQIRVSETLNKSTKKLYDVVKRKRRIGSAEVRHLLWAESNFDDTSKSVLDAKRAYREALLKLTALAGFDSKLYVESNLSDNYIEKLCRRVKLLENKNRGLSAVKLDVKTARLDLTSSKNDKLPKLDFSGSLSAGSLSDNFSSAYSKWSDYGFFMGLSFIWDIANTTPRMISLASKEYLKSLDFKYESKLFSINKDIEILLNDITSYKKQLKLTLDRSRKLGRRFDLEWRAFKLGRAAMRDVVDAQKAEALAGVEVLRLRYVLLDAVYTLAWIKGSLAELVR